MRFEPDPVMVDDADDGDWDVEATRGNRGDPVERAVRRGIENSVPLDRRHTLRLVFRDYVGKSFQARIPPNVSVGAPDVLKRVPLKSFVAPSSTLPPHWEEVRFLSELQEFSALKTRKRKAGAQGGVLIPTRRALR